MLRVRLRFLLSLTLFIVATIIFCSSFIFNVSDEVNHNFPKTGEEFGTSSGSERIPMEMGLKLLRLMGGRERTILDFDNLVKLLSGEYPGPSRTITVLRMRQLYYQLKTKKALGKMNNNYRKLERRTEPVLVNIAFVACGESRYDAMVMLKSVILLSQDLFLHIIAFSNNESIIEIGEDLLGLRLTLQALDRDLTYELHLESADSVRLKDGMRECATQRLFFPSLLPHIDSLLYLDTDILLLSNLSSLWQQFHSGNMTGKLIGIAPNSELPADGYYNLQTKIPYFGSRGLNTGVMLMNLTAMRLFQFEAHVKSVYATYGGKLDIPDQDIVNIIFHNQPDKLHLLDCTYNFNFAHCTYGVNRRCHFDFIGGVSCFCNASLTNGIRILHGNGGTFHNGVFPFLMDIFKAFQNFDLMMDSYQELIISLKNNFNLLHDRPCRPLTSELLYQNAESYFHGLEAE